MTGVDYSPRIVQICIDSFLSKDGSMEKVYVGLGEDSGLYAYDVKKHKWIPFSESVSIPDKNIENTQNAI